LSTLFLIPAVALGASPWDGTWKLKTDSIKFEGPPDVFDVTNGTYNCKSCVPAYSIRADGAMQPIPGHAYTDHESVKVSSPTSIELTDTLGGKPSFKTTLTASADGKRITAKGIDYTGAKPIDFTYTEKRLAAGPAGSHAISGTWMQDSLGDVTPEGLTVTITSTPNGMKMVFNGHVTDAKFDGKEYPVVGDPGKTTTTLKPTGERSMEETDHRLGKVTDIITWTLAPDGKTLIQVDKDQLHGTTTTYPFQRQ
jgi:hypothetical protein